MDKLQPVCAMLSYLSAWVTTLLGVLYQFTSLTLGYLSANAPGIGVVITVMMYLTNLFMQVRRDRREAKLTEFYMQENCDRRDPHLEQITNVADDER